MEEKKPNKEELTFGKVGVPLWVKIMWAIGILWIIGYVVMAIVNGPANW